jgi:hypothetical protein
MGIMTERLIETLRAARLLPDAPIAIPNLAANGNLLPTLKSLWSQADLNCKNRAHPVRVRRMTQWIQNGIDAGAYLGCGLPDRNSAVAIDATRSLVADRLCWWPRGIPEGSWIALVSSRLRRRLDLIPEWFAAFREACRSLDGAADVLFTGKGTTTERYVRRAAAHAGFRTLTLHAPRGRSSAANWLRKIDRGGFPVSAERQYDVYLSPPLDDTRAFDGACDLRGQSGPSGPLTDRVVTAWADELFVLRIRRGGNLEPLVRSRLAQGPNAGIVHLAVGPNLVTESLALELIEFGARAWSPCRTNASDRAHNVRRVDPASSLAAQPHRELAAIDSDRHITSGTGQNDCQRVHTLASWSRALATGKSSCWNFLTHCTHAAIGPWPGQTDDEYLDELLFAACPQPRTPFAALVRILSEQRIRASPSALRGGTQAVCLTAVPLDELHRLRAFQPQRQCWSFEPYGICLSRDMLLARGARPVVYGDEDDWNRLSADDRPFFQLRRTNHATRPRDWTAEREWRYLGDIDLASVPSAGALVFVPTEEEAAQIARHSLWPVIALT